MQSKTEAHMEKAKGDRGGKAASHSTGTAKWTFMVYMAGDNNLDGAALETRRHKKRASSGSPCYWCPCRDSNAGPAD
jgi:hypothetical protein